MIQWRVSELFDLQCENSLHVGGIHCDVLFGPPVVGQDCFPVCLEDSSVCG